MGAVKRDTHENERNLTARYPALDNPLGLRILLGDYHALTQRRYAGDTAASDILIDLATAVQLANLTNRQRQALDLVCGEDLTQVEAGKRMDIAQKNVSEALDRALEAVAEVYWYWSAHGEGYAVGNGVTTEGESA